MSVKELIQKLSTYPKNYEIVLAIRAVSTELGSNYMLATS